MGYLSIYSLSYLVGLRKANLSLPSTMGIPERNKDGVERYFLFPVIKICGSGRWIKTLMF